MTDALPDAAAGHAEFEVDTPHGTARVHLSSPASPRALVVLGHGAGGGVDAPDLLAVAKVAAGLDAAVARVLQPYRVAGRRAPAPAAQLDASWAAVVAALRERRPDVPQIHGGRSSGARVACRGAVTLPVGLRPDAVLALAFPLRPPGKPPYDPRYDRGPELDAVTVSGIAVLAVSGDRDRFGVPDATAGREVVVVPGDHALRSRRAVADAVRPWLGRVVGGGRV